MRRALILSVRPEHAYNILTGKKTLEIRKRVPKGYKGWVYVYVTKAIKDYRKGFYYQPKNKEDIFRLHGNIPCRFWFDGKRIIHLKKLCNGNYYWANDRDISGLNYNLIMDNLVLSASEIWDYGKGKDLYAWHINNLEIFDKPMELGEFYKHDYWFERKHRFTPITKAPQSYMYAWVKEEMK